METKLLPCPFCGETPIYYGESPYGFTYIGGWSSRTSLSCCVTMEESYGEDGQSKQMPKNEDEAKKILYEKWNKRI